MNPETFKQSWTRDGDTLTPLNPEKLKQFTLLPLTAEFLSTAGLPHSAAPFVSFVDDSDDEYDGISKLTAQYDFLGPEFEKYVVIGSYDGDPIAINTLNNDQVEWLDHGNGFSSRFFNSSVRELAACLLAYRGFIERVQQENGEDAFLEPDFTDEQFEHLTKNLAQADPKALSEGFWKAMLQNDIALRSDDRSKE